MTDQLVARQWSATPAITTHHHPSPPLKGAEECPGKSSSAVSWVAAARLGARVAAVGAVGTDAFGEQLLAALQAEGVEGLARGTECTERKWWLSPAS